MIDAMLFLLVGSLWLAVWVVIGQFEAAIGYWRLLRRRNNDPQA